MKLKWYEKVYTTYIHTVQSLEPEAKASLKNGLQLIGLGIFVLGAAALLMSNKWLVLGGGASIFGACVIIMADMVLR